MPNQSELTAILESLRAVPAILASFVAAIPEARLQLRRGSAWTIAEHLSHLAEVQPMVRGRLERILNEETPEFVPYFPAEDEIEPVKDSMPVADALQAFALERASLVERLEGLDAAQWNRMARHPEYAQYGLHILARHILLHDHWHLYRMEELWLTRDEYLTES